MSTGQPPDRPGGWQADCVTAGHARGARHRGRHRDPDNAPGGLLRAGYGVCEGFSADLIPFTPGVDVIVSDGIAKPFVVDDLVARVERLAIAREAPRAA